MFAYARGDIEDPDNH